MIANSSVFAVKFSGIKAYWEVRSVRISLTNRSFWKTIPMGSICKVRFEITTNEELETGQIQLLDRISFNEGKVHFGRRTQTKMTQYRAKPGDIAVSKINARKRAIGIVPDDVEVGLTIHFRALIPDKSQVDTQFLWLALRSDFCKNQFDVETGGIGKGEISEEKLLSIEVPLPPLNTQHAIVAHWQNAQNSITEAEEKITELEQGIEKQFFADLSLKVSPLVPNLKVFAARSKDFERWSVSYNQAVLSSVNISKGKYPVVELGDILSMVQYGSSEKASTEKIGTPVIRMNNIVDGVLDLSDLKYIRLSQRDLERLLLKDGEILFNRTNSKELVGKCAVFHEKDNYIFASYLIRIRAEKSKADPDYISFVLNNRIGRQQINALSRQIIGQANVNSQELRSLRLPLPPLKTQQEIMTRIEAGRAEITRQKELAEKIRRDSEMKVEGLILGTKKL